MFREVIHPTLTTRIGISTYWSLFSRLPPAPGDPGHIHLAVLHCASNHPKWQQPWKEEKGKAFGFNGTWSFNERNIWKHGRSAETLLFYWHSWSNISTCDLKQLEAHSSQTSQYLDKLLWFLSLNSRHFGEDALTFHHMLGWPPLRSLCLNILGPPVSSDTELGEFYSNLAFTELNPLALASFRVITLHYPKQKSIDEMIKYKITWIHYTVYLFLFSTCVMALILCFWS